VPTQTRHSNQFLLEETFLSQDAGQTVAGIWQNSQPRSVGRLSLHLHIAIREYVNRVSTHITIREQVNRVSTHITIREYVNMVSTHITIRE